MAPTPRVRTRPTVLVALRHRASFLEQYTPGDGHGGLLIPGDYPYLAGEPVTVELSFMEEKRGFRLRGTVKWTRPDAPDGPGAAMAVEFQEADRTTRDKVLDFVQGKHVKFVERADHRFPVALQIAYQTESTFITDYTDDLSQGGAFIVTPRKVALGTIMPLRVKLPGHLLALKLKGVVCWVRESGPQGVGVKFLFESDRQRKAVQRLVADLKAQIILQMQGRHPSGRQPAQPSRPPPTRDDP